MKSDSIQRQRVPLLSQAHHLRALLGIILATCACVLALTPASALAADAGVISVATVSDSDYENNNDVGLIDITQDTQRTANISGSQRTAYTKANPIHVELSGLSYQGTGLNKTIEVTLAQGVKWVDDTSEALAAALDTSKGTNGIERIALPKLDKKFDLGGGTRIYYLEDGIRSIGFDLDYTVDSTFAGGTGTVIKNPITITVKESGNIVGKAGLKGLTNNVDGFPNTPTDVEAPVWEGEQEHSRTIGSNTWIQGQGLGYAPNVFYEFALRDEHFATITIDNPDAKIMPNVLDGVLFDDSGAAEGVYKVKALNNPWSKQHLGRSSFFVYFPEADFQPGDTVAVNCHYDMKCYDVDGKPYSLTCDDKTYTVTAVKEKHQIFINSDDPENPVRDVPIRYWRVNKGDGVLSYHTWWSHVQEDGKIVEQHFDPNAHIYASEVIVPAGTTSAVGMTFTVGYIPAGSDTELTTQVTLPSNTINKEKQYANLHTQMISYGDLGLSIDDSITMLKYETNIPACTLQGLRSLGRIVDMTLTPTNRLEIYSFDEQGEKVSDGVSTVVHYPLEGLTAMANSSITSQTVTPGTKSATIRLQTHSGWISANNGAAGMHDPIYYIVITLKDNTGSYLKIDNPQIRDSNLKWYKVTEDILEERVVPDLGRIYIIDTLKVAAKYTEGTTVPQFYSTFGFALANSAGKINIHTDNLVHFNIVVPKNVENQSQAYANMLYVEDRYYDNTVFARGIQNEDQINATKVDLYKMGISHRQHPSGNAYFASSCASTPTDAITIRAYPDFTVDTAVKHESATDYTVWNEGDAPITVGNSTSFDIKVDLNNAGGAPLNNPTVVYIPIPKKDEYWGGLNKVNVKTNASSLASITNR